MTAAIPRIEAIEHRTEGLVVRFHGNSSPMELPWFWVRDHSVDPGSRDASTGQRLVDLASIPDDLTAAGSQVGDGVVLVHWGEGLAPAVLPVALLADVAGLIDEPSPVLWRAGTMPDPLPEVGCREVMDTDDGVRTWLEAVERFGFALVRGLETTADAAEAIARRIAAPRSTIFGTMWRLAPYLAEHADSSYSEMYLEPHTDGTYLHDAPGLQTFVCLARAGAGGESILVDGFAAAERLRDESPEAFEVLTRVSVPGRYVEPGVDLRASRPTIRVDQDGRISQVSFNNYDRAPLLLAPEPLAAWFEAYRRFHRILNDRADWLLVPLAPGDVLTFDNWRVLHGRQAYEGDRVFQGCYHNHGDFESRLRVLRGTHGSGSTPT